jgi:hypothetical protein
MSIYHTARAKGYALVKVFVDEMEAAVPDGLTGYQRAKWLEDAYGAAAAVVNGEHRDAFAATAAAYANGNAA